MVHNLGMYCIPLLSLIIVKPKGCTIGWDVQVLKLEIQNHTVTAVLTVQTNCSYFSNKVNFGLDEKSLYEIHEKTV